MAKSLLRRQLDEVHEELDYRCLLAAESGDEKEKKFLTNLIYVTAAAERYWAQQHEVVAMIDERQMTIEGC